MSRHRRRWASAQRRWSGVCTTREARMMRRAAGGTGARPWYLTGLDDPRLALMRDVRAGMAADLDARLRDVRRLITIVGI